MSRLFHFSEDPAIDTFVPRPVTVPSPRRAGQEWLNGPLVWAIDEWHQPMYFFPRDCPRILIWPLPHTTDEDRAAWFGGRDARMIAHIEWRWFERFCGATVARYELPAHGFTALEDAGMWVSCDPVAPVGVEVIDDLPGALNEARVELRVMESLTPLRNAWDSTMHVSGIRLRNASGWATE
jgi:hypothetical protein